MQEAINSGSDAGAQDATSETNSICEIEDVYFTRSALDESRCIGMSVYRHEQFHQARCKERESGKWQPLRSSNAPLKILIDTRFAMSVERDNWVPGKQKGDECQLDLSLEGCSTRQQKNDKGCPCAPWRGADARSDVRRAGGTSALRVGAR